jgi:hypothetical protein
MLLVPFCIRKLLPVAGNISGKTSCIKAGFVLLSRISVLLMLTQNVAFLDIAGVHQR